MRAYGRARQHPKGYPGLGLRNPDRPWWEGEGAQPEKGRARAEGKAEIIEQIETPDPRLNGEADMIP
jgi:hypothetical protein